MSTKHLSYSSRRVAAYMVIAAAVAAAALAWRIATQGNTHAPAEADATPTAAVQTVRVARESIAEPVQAYGSIFAGSANAVTVNVPYTARVMHIRVQLGQAVKRDAPLVDLLADASASLAAAQAKNTAVLARDELARTQSMFDKGLATQSQLDSAKKALLDAQDVLAAQQRMGVTAGVQTVTAPSDAIVTQISVSQGDQTQPGAALVQLAVTGRAGDGWPNVMLGVEPSDAATIRPGDTVTLHGLSSALEQQTLEGRVTTVGAAVDPQSQLVDVGALVAVPTHSLFIPGTRVRADIATAAGTYWVVPRSAVLRDDSGNAYLFQVTADAHAKRVPVAVKVEADNRYGVDGPIDAGLPVVVGGNYELQDGMAVRASGGTAR